MSQSPTTRIADKAKVFMGQSPPSAANSEKGEGLPFIQGNAEFGRRHPTPMLRCSVPTRIAEAGDLLLSVRAPVGELNQAVERTVIGRGLSALRFDPVQQNFAWHSVKFAASTLNRVAQGSTFVAVGREDVERLEIPWHDEVNSDIATVLDTVDEAIAKTEAVIAKLRQIRAGLLHDLLTRGLNKNGQLRDPIAHPEQFQDSPLGQIPKEWEVCLLDDVAIRGSGHTPSKDVSSYWNGGIKWVSLADSDKLDRIYISETDKEISELGIENSSAVKHPAGTVILSRDAGIGKSAILEQEMAVSQHFIAWRCGKRLHNVFLYYWLQQNKSRFEAIAMGSTIKTIGLAYFKRLQIAVPQIDEQQTAADVMLASEAAISAEEVELIKLHQLNSGLMTDLLTGLVRVPEKFTTKAVNA